MSHALLSPSYDPTYEFNAPKYYDFTSQSPGIADNYFGAKYDCGPVPCELPKEDKTMTRTLARANQKGEVGSASSSSTSSTPGAGSMGAPAAQWPQRKSPKSAKPKGAASSATPSSAGSAVATAATTTNSSSSSSSSSGKPSSAALSSGAGGGGEGARKRGRSPSAPPKPHAHPALTLPKSPSFMSKGRMRGTVHHVSSAQRELDQIQAAREALKKSVAANARRAARMRNPPVTSSKGSGSGSSEVRARSAEPVPAQSSDLGARKPRASSASARPHLPPQPRPHVTQPEAFQLKTETRASKRRREALQAGPPVLPKRAWKPALTKPEPFELFTDLRAVHRPHAAPPNAATSPPHGFVSLRSQADNFLKTVRAEEVPNEEGENKKSGKGTTQKGERKKRAWTGQLTQPQEFNLATSSRARAKRRRTDEAPIENYVSLQSRVNSFLSEGRSGAVTRSMAHHGHGAGPSQSASHGVTKPRPFELFTDLRAKGREVARDSSLPFQELANKLFERRGNCGPAGAKAGPGAGNSGGAAGNSGGAASTHSCDGHPHGGLTVPEPFSLATEQRAHHKPKEVAEDPVTVTKSGSNCPTSPLKLQAPFLAELAKRRLEDKIREEEKREAEARVFHARPMPDLSKCLVVSKSRVALTVMESPHLKSSTRASRRRSFEEKLHDRQRHALEQLCLDNFLKQEQEKLEVKELRATMVPKALPYPPPQPVAPKTEPRRQRRELTVPETPPLRTRSRALQRAAPFTPPTSRVLAMR